MKNFIKPIVAFLMAATFMAAYLTVYEYVIYFHEQHHLFRFSWQYVCDTAHQSGILWPVTEFVVQFGYYTWLGALVWTLLCVGAYCMAQGAISRLTGLRDLIQVSAIPSVAMFFYTTEVDRFPVISIKIFLGVAAIWLLSLVLTKCVPALHKRYAALKASPAGGKWWVVLFAVACFFGVFYAGYQMSMKERDVELPSGKMKHQTHNDRVHQRDVERLMIDAERALNQRNWPRVLELTTEQAMTGEPNHLMSYFRCLALYHTGQLTSHLFDFPLKYGAQSFFFPWKAERNRAEFGGYVFEELGAINSANHWEFEALVGWGETARHLSSLAKYAIASGKTQQARKYIAPLKATLFYRSKAAELEEWLKNGKVPDLKISIGPEEVMPHCRWDNVENLGGDLSYILLHDPQNQMAREYSAMFFLAANNLGAFWNTVRKYWPMPDHGYLPPLIEQGLSLVKMHIGDEAFAQTGYRISPDTEAALADYLAEHGKGNMAHFPPKMRQTFWYYVHHTSPNGPELTF